MGWANKVVDVSDEYKKHYYGKLLLSIMKYNKALRTFSCLGGVGVTL
jgi:hypothetical protein